MILLLIITTVVYSDDRVDSLVLLANDHTTRGITNVEQKNYAEAEQAFLKSIDQWDKIDTKHVLRAYPHYQLFFLYQTLGEFDQSILHYRKAENILLSLGDEYLGVLSGLYNSIGYFYLNYGDYQKALDYNNKALEILVKSNTVEGLTYANVIYGLAETMYFQNRNSETIELILSYLVTGRELKDRFNILLGSAYMNIQQYGKSIKTLEKTVGDLEGKQSEDYGEALLVLAKSYLFNGEIDKSESCLNEAYPILTRTKNSKDSWIVYYYELYGQCLLVKAETDTSSYNKLALYTEAINIFDKALLTNSSQLGNKIPYLEVEGEFITPTQVKDVFVSRGDALQQLADLYFEQEDYFTGINFLDRALKTSEATIEYLHDLRISFLEEESKLDLSAQTENVYTNGFHIAANLFQQTNQQRYFNKMLEFSEAGKSATFLASLNDVKAKNFGGIPDSLIEKERNINLKLTSLKQLVFNEQNQAQPDSILILQLEQQIFNLENEHDELIFLFEREYPDFYDFKYANSYVSTESIIKQLGREDALIEYFVDEPAFPGDSGTVNILLFQKSGASFFQKRIDDNYERNIEILIRELTNSKIGNTNSKNYYEFLQSSNYLYQLLLDSLELDKKISNLIIIPDGKLSYVPFDALISEMPEYERMDFRKLKYLVFNYSISYSYSATLHFNYFKSNQRTGQKILALAPEYVNYEFDLYKAAYRKRQINRDVLRPLPGAKQEVEGLSKYKKCSAYIGEDASETKFKEVVSDYDILHLAMHTILNDSIPMFSKLVFSKPADSIDDGYLNTQEIYNLKLDARMAVLSACNTGTGQLRTGEGVMSLSRAFLFAGCPSIVMTLWEVEDGVSADIMLTFYKYLFKGYSKSKALQMAKIDHIKNADPLKSHPYFWQAYIVVGDPEAIVINNNVLLSIVVFTIVLVVLLYTFFRYFAARKKGQA